MELLVGAWVSRPMTFEYYATGRSIQCRAIIRPRVSIRLLLWGQMLYWMKSDQFTYHGYKVSSSICSSRPKLPFVQYDLRAFPSVVHPRPEDCGNSIVVSGSSFKALLSSRPRVQDPRPW